jgi:tetratricopeptide (TPR) repeat protein
MASSIRIDRLVFIGLLVLLAGEPLAAETTAAPAVEMAKLHFKKGEAEYEAGRYAAAIDEYQIAYGLAPAPGLLFNIAKCYRLDGDRERALDYYRRYLSADPEGPGWKEAVAQIAVLEPGVRPPPPPSVVIVPAAPSAVAPPVRWPGWALLGAGAALGFGGTSLVLWSRRDFHDLQRECGTRCDPGAADGPRSREAAGYALVAGAGVALVTGAIWLVVTSQERRHP